MEQNELVFDFESNIEKHNERTMIGYSDHQFVRLNVFNTRVLKHPRVVEFTGKDYVYHLTSRMSSVHLTMMELIVKLAGQNSIRNSNGTTTFFFDMSELVKYYPGNTNSVFLIQKIRELGGTVDEQGLKLGTYLQSWKNGTGKAGKDHEASSSGGIVVDSGYADGEENCEYIAEKKVLMNRSSLDNLKGVSENPFSSKSTQFYFSVTFSKAWVNFVKDSKLLKTATLKGIITTGSIRNNRLQLVARFMSGQKPGVSRNLDYLIEKLELRDNLDDKAWWKVNKDFLQAIEKEDNALLTLGIKWDSERKMFTRFSSIHVSVIKNPLITD